jgi:hypothetical protein
LAVAAHQAFTTAMSSGLEVAAAVAIAGAVVAAVGLPARRRARVVDLAPAQLSEPECAAA